MSAFKDGRYPVELDKTRHILFDLNVMDEIQERFGDLEKLGEIMNGPDRFRNIRAILTLLLNEGAEEGEEPLTEKEVGKKIHAGNIVYVQECIFKAIAIGSTGQEEQEDDATDQGEQKAGQVA